MTLRTLLRGSAAFSLSAILASAALGQDSSDLSLRWSGGVLGWSWTLELEGAPQGLYLLAPSFESGPTPLALVDPTDPRSLEVGLDLLQFWRFGQLDAFGAAQEVYLLPPTAGLVGADVRAQALEVPGSAGLVGSLSEVAQVRLSLLGSGVAPQGAPVAARQDHAQIALADGRVLLAGGRPLAGSTTSLECFDPQTQTFEKLDAALPEQLFHQAATLLADGRVLLTGGVLPGRGVSDRAFLFDPQSDKLEVLPPMNSARVLHTTTLLGNGRVLVTGGAGKFTESHPLGLPDCVRSQQASCELFDPESRSWLPALPLPRALVGHAATFTPQGAVFITGGVRAQPLGSSTESAVWRRQGPGPWILAGQLLEPRAFHAQVISADGAALLIGSGAKVDEAGGQVLGTTTCEVWSTAGGTSTLGPSSTRIVVGGEEVCIPLPRLPKFPTGVPKYIGEVEEDPKLGPPIVYWMGGGYSGLSFEAGPALPNDRDQTTLYFSEDWKLVGPPSGTGPGHRVTSIDGGLRRLAVGPLGALLVTAE